MKKMETSAAVLEFPIRAYSSMLEIAVIDRAAPSPGRPPDENNSFGSA